MKRVPLLSLLLVTIISSCNSQQTAKQQAIEEKKAIETVRPGTIPTKAGGWTMTAVIDGKKWTATSIMPPEAAGRVIGYYKDNEYIGLPNIERRFIQFGKKELFSEHNAVDLSVSGDDNFYGGYTGDMTITKMTSDWVEGIFHFTATSRGSTRKIEVTDGFFRIQVK